MPKSDNEKLALLAKAIEHTSGVNETQLKGKARCRQLVRTREIFCHLAINSLHIKQKSISECIGRSVSDINYLNQTCLSDIETDQHFAQLVIMTDCEVKKLVGDDYDEVNHPPYYTWLKEKCGVEVIDITRHLDFPRGCAVKYILRAGYKSIQTEIRDLQKAIWYLNDKIKTLQKEQGKA